MTPSKMRDMFNIALLLLFISAVGYAVYAIGLVNIGPLVLILGVCWALGLALTVLRRAANAPKR
jgi:hypothetical protein